MGKGGHGEPPKTAIVMTRLDGTAMSRKEVIKKRRGALKWLPVLCSNDLVHGSWWFVFGSAGGMLSAILPLIQQYENFYKTHDDLLPPVDFTLTWVLLIFSGFWFTVGSFAFLRAFEEPPRQAIFYWFKHMQTDELLGAWCFMLGTAPAVPYTLVYFIVDPTFTFLGALAGSGVFVLGSIVFVMASYPSNQTTHNPSKQRKNYVLPLALRMFGARIWVVKHLQNDWLAGTWFLLWANVLFTVFSFLLLFTAVGTGDPEQIFLWLSSAVNSFFFLVGSLYFVSGSYPHATQFYYAVDRGKRDGPLEYDAPENLPDYSDPSDTNDITDVLFGHGKGGASAGAAAGAHRPGKGDADRDMEAGVQLQEASNPLHQRAAPPARAAGPAATAPAAASSSSSSSSSSSGHGMSATSSAGIDHVPSAGSLAGASGSSGNLHLKAADAMSPPKPVLALTHDEDENFDDDEDEVDHDGAVKKGSGSALGSAVYSPLTAMGQRPGGGV